LVNELITERNKNRRIPTFVKGYSLQNSVFVDKWGVLLITAPEMPVISGFQAVEILYFAYKAGFRRIKS